MPPVEPPLKDPAVARLERFTEARKQHEEHLKLQQQLLKQQREATIQLQKDTDALRKFEKDNPGSPQIKGMKEEVNKSDAVVKDLAGTVFELSGNISTLAKTMQEFSSEFPAEAGPSSSQTGPPAGVMLPVHSTPPVESQAPAVPEQGASEPSVDAALEAAVIKALSKLALQSQSGEGSVVSLGSQLTSGSLAVHNLLRSVSRSTSVRSAQGPQSFVTARGDSALPTPPVVGQAPQFQVAGRTFHPEECSEVSTPRLPMMQQGNAGSHAMQPAPGPPIHHGYSQMGMLNQFPNGASSLGPMHPQQMQNHMAYTHPLTSDRQFRERPSQEFRNDFWPPHAPPYGSDLSAAYPQSHAFPMHQTQDGHRSAVAMHQEQRSAPSGPGWSHYPSAYVGPVDGQPPAVPPDSQASVQAMKMSMQSHSIRMDMQRAPQFSAVISLISYIKYQNDWESYFHSYSHILLNNTPLQFQLLSSTLKTQTAKQFLSKYMEDVIALCSDPAAGPLLRSSRRAMSALEIGATMQERQLIEATGKGTRVPTPAAAPTTSQDTGPKSLSVHTQEAVREAFGQVTPVEVNKVPLIWAWMAVVEKHLCKPTPTEIAVWNTGMVMGKSNRF